MITEKNLLEYFSRKQYRPSVFDELCFQFNIEQKDRKRFRKLLKFLQAQFKIIRNKEKRYTLLKEEDFVTGTLRKNPKGFGFLICDDSTQEDIYLSRLELEGVMNKDRLKVLVGPKRSGKVVQILQRGLTQIMGTLCVKGQSAFVIPQGSYSENEIMDVLFYKDLSKAHKQLVVCKIKKYPKENKRAYGEVIKILGHSGLHEIDFSSMVYKYNLRNEFSEAILDQANACKKWNLKEEIEQRKDLRPLPFVTIDGETAKDFDDAVYVEKLSNGHFKLWVSIADVSYFVKENSVLDEEAFERATSIYFPGGVIPMFPSILSNDLCSLNPNEEKLTFTCEMEFDEKGNRKHYSIYESVIISHKRMTYTEVQAILDQKQNVPHIKIMNELKELLKKLKHKRGSLDFDLPEPEIVLNTFGKIETIVKRPRLESHMIIEEFMIAANEAVAEYMFQRNNPFIYRVHEKPDPSDLLEFQELVHNLGFLMNHEKEPHPRIYSELLEKIKNTPKGKVIHTALLRSMKLARYDTKNQKHFGLASDCYTHFTSPIRRYPDLLVHRLLKAELKKNHKYSDSLEEAANHCSQQERIAEEAEREFMSLKKAQFMKDKVGSQFVGFVSHITDSGFLVELDPYFIEGWIPLSSLQDDFYQFIPEHYYLKGRRTKREFHLGQKLLVEVSHVDLDKRIIGLEWIDSL